MVWIGVCVWLLWMVLWLLWILCRILWSGFGGLGLRMVCVWSVLWCLRVSCRVVFRGLSWLPQFLVGALGGFAMVGDDLLCRFSESEVIVQDDQGWVRGSCILSGQFCGWWVRDGRMFSKELGRPGAELWSMVKCSVICGHWRSSETSNLLLMVKDDSFVPVSEHWWRKPVELAEMIREDWADFGPTDKALVERVIEQGVAALAG